MPVMMFESKAGSHCIVLRSENWVSGRLSGSRTIIIQYLPGSLVGQVNFSSTAEVNFQRPTSTRVISTRQQDTKTVLLCCCHPGTALILYPGSV